ncbi:hypothetical protein ACPA54_30775 [Uniformispora flossi]|uniref:hypothetical protein n=1 Tax=Uniformispora flossi TaxID=3390723 RepID=UPI003C2B5C4B
MDEEVDEEELLAIVQRLVWHDATGPLECRRDGHQAGHVCLSASGDIAYAALTAKLGDWFGPPRGLVAHGQVDSAATGAYGRPLLAPFGEELVEMAAWAYAGRWVGSGTTSTGDGLHPVVVVAARPDPAAGGVPEDASWVERVVAVTGWEPCRGPRSVDWAAVERRLGTALPGDYKQLAEIFGHGAFDGYLELSVPDASFAHADLVRQSESLAAFARTHGNGQWEPHSLFPAPGGLLPWAASEQADRFYWLTDGPDPDKWPIVMSEDIPDSWEQYDGSTAEFVYRMLTDRQHPFSTARHFDVHWFQSYARGEAADG